MKKYAALLAILMSLFMLLPSAGLGAARAAGGLGSSDPTSVLPPPAPTPTPTPAGNPASGLGAPATDILEELKPTASPAATPTSGSGLGGPNSNVSPAPDPFVGGPGMSGNGVGGPSTGGGSLSTSKIGREIALTFDDGPNSMYTTMILDILKDYNAHATFFVLGSKVESNAGLLHRMAGEGHEIGSHSYNHSDLRKLSSSSIRRDLTHTNDLIKEACGVTPTLLRPPYGGKNDRVKAVAEELGMSLILWSVDSMDWDTSDYEKVYKNVYKEVKDGSIVLFHDRKLTGIKACELLIKTLHKEGYIFVTVSQLFNNKLQAGDVYYHG